MPKSPVLIQPVVVSSIESGTPAKVIECLPTSIAPAGGNAAAGVAEGLGVGARVGASDATATVRPADVTCLRTAEYR